MKAVVLGAGRMGCAAAWDLARQPETELVTLVDFDPRNLEQGITELRALADKYPEAGASFEARSGNLEQEQQLVGLLEGFDVALSSADYRFNVALTRAAIEAGVRLCDLGGNLFVVRDQIALSAEAEARGITVIPDCGLAPGMACMLAALGVEQFDHAETVSVRVGGLPANPKPPLNYKLVFSVRGLTNEYLEPAEVVRDGERIMVPSLIDVEALEFPEPFGTLEAFNTSGGISTLPQTLAGRVTNMDYKTIRYPGHCAVFRAMESLGFLSEEPVDGIDPRKLTESLLTRALTDDDTDVVLVRVTVEGRRNGGWAQLTYQCIDYHDPETGHSAMARTTAYPAAAVAYLLGIGAVERSGVLPGEQALPLARFAAEVRRRGIAIDEVWD